MKAQNRPAGRQIRYFKILPAHSAAPPGSNSFHARFFSREPRRIALKPIGFALDVSDLGCGEYTVDKALPVAFDGFPDAIHLREIDTGSNNQSAAPVEVIVSFPCLIPLVLIKASAMAFTSLDRPFITSTSRQLSWSRCTCKVDRMW